MYADFNIPDETVAGWIANYQANYRNSSQPPFEVSSVVAIKKAVQSSYGRFGIYVLYRADATLIYIGMSLQSIATRINCHLSQGERASAFWTSRTPTLARTVFVPQSWEALSLEGFLVNQAEAVRRSSRLTGDSSGTYLR